ncbi:hypothetical protein Pme01_44840 [Planosporangium mesophilum]|uniref:Uncharacterized protein n=1 Tax=Planosporangium mesophilum TaxID=689768 RepID=A0A8J3TFL0_9ACTN|nr:hypothetical protein [Planosporangium mesophilum]GII24887.1 hypothetical protein Pme01_44840 [Planosporangium mesophilum]
MTVTDTLRNVEAQPDDVFDDVALVLRSALAGDGDGVVDAFDKAAVRSGVTGAYEVAWSLAGATVGDGIVAGPWRLEFPGIEEAPYDKRWVARFLSAYANADDASGEALFGAAIADGKLPQCLMTLAGSAVATLRRRDGGER